MSLWGKNRPQDFWLVAKDAPAEVWITALKNAASVLEIKEISGSGDVEKILEYTLGEGQFGAGHWELSTMKRWYYQLKPFIPRSLTRIMRRIYSGETKKEFQLGWPTEKRYVRFLWETLRQVIILMGWNQVSFINFWPEKYHYALVLTHDIETATGQAYVRQVAELEIDNGLRSSFNFIPERYPLDHALIGWLREHGFEIGVHGLKHDGKEFFDKHTFSERAKKINRYMKELHASGFRAPLTHRNPAWMQELEIGYDASFFDTDPFEPIPGGVMTIWPFFLGRFIEMPYTLVQDYSLINIVGEKTPRIWLEKVDFIRDHHGMALINTHPDYLMESENIQIYIDFLKEMKRHNAVWNALPAEAAVWWRTRSEAHPLSPGGKIQFANARIAGENLIIEC